MRRDKTILLYMIIILLSLTGCAEGSKSHAPNDQYTTSVIDPDLEPYYESFLQEAAKRGVDIRHQGITIQYNPQLKAAGRCSPSLKRIEVSEYYVSVGVKLLGPWYKEYVLYHELAHCLLMILSHDDSKYNLMMTDPPPNDFLYNLYKDYYLDILFNEHYYKK